MFAARAQAKRVPKAGVEERILVTFVVFSAHVSDVVVVHVLNTYSLEPGTGAASTICSPDCAKGAAGRADVLLMFVHAGEVNQGVATTGEETGPSVEDTPATSNV